MKLYRIDYHTIQDTTTNGLLVEADSVAEAEGKVNDAFENPNGDTDIVIENGPVEVPKLDEGFNLWRF